MRWRRVLAAGLVVVVAAWAAALASGALAPTPEPLAGGNFQGADGDQVRRGTFDDWATLPVDRVAHNPDPNADDSAFTGGSKEGDPAHWGLGTEAGGVTPAKANILDAWSAVDQPAGRTFLYLGFSRAASTGDTFLTFELNRSGRTWRNDNGARIPCRRDGDVLVSYEISGNAADVVLHRWHTEVTDAEAGCDRTGTIEPAASVEADAQGAINAATITNHLPGFYGAVIGSSRFGEAALDIEALLRRVFADKCFAFGSMWMHSRASRSFTSQMQDYVAPVPINLRTCAAEGVKFFDLDADGVRDPRDPGLPGFQIYADYNDDGQLDPGEPSTVTDSDGRYVLTDIRQATYRLRERLLPTRRRQTNRWLCSFPNDDTDGGFGVPGLGFPCGWGPIDTGEEPNAKGRDFGNWYPAQLTVVKDLVPADDPGRFNLFVNGSPVLQNAPETASSRRLAVPPGRYTVSEQAIPPAELGQYTVTPSCRVLSPRARASSGTASITLAAGQRGECRILNVRLGHPAIRIEKTGPGLAEAGDTLRYTLRVTNPGSVPFDADDVTVADPTCDDPPELSGKLDGSGPDGTPGSLDPGDVWIYRCSVKTDAPGDDCALQSVRNTATVTGEAGGTTVTYSSTIDTTLTCPGPPDPPDPPEPPDPPVPPDPPDPPVPPQPPDPIPPTPIVPGLPDVPSAVFPDVARPPRAGAAGVAGLASSRLGRCVTRLPHLAIRGRHVSRVTLFLDGRRIRLLRGTPLQRRHVIRNLARRTVTPGRLYTMVARVQFRLGSGTRPLSLVRRVRICRALLPRFTG